MHRILRPSVKARILSSRIGSLLLLFQRSPVVQMLFPEARILGGARLGEMTKWTVATVAGLGAYDTVSGASAIVQIAPEANAVTVPAARNSVLSFIYQSTGTPHTPGSWQVVGNLPNGLTHTNSKNSATDSISGTPTVSGNFSITVKAWENSDRTGGSVSQMFTINVGSTIIATQPSPILIESGDTATLSVIGNGGGLSYQWYRGNPPNTGNPQPGKTAASFTTPALTSATTYWVQVTRSNGVIANSNAATVSIGTRPAITSQPASDLTINPGETATLSAAASGTSPSYQWYLGAVGDTSNPAPGATSTTFTTPALQSTTSYWFSAINPLGFARSEAALINVRIPPQISTQPSPVTINTGGTATLTVAASGTSPTYQWYEGSSGVTTNPVAGATEISFTTPVLTSTTRFWVRATNPAGIADSDAALITVNTPPDITTEPQSTAINEGGSTTFTVTASGTSPSFQWYLGESGDTTTLIDGATSATFTTPPLMETTRYWVRATNELGISDSLTATVTVQFAPVFTTPPASTAVNLGSSATFTFVATDESPTFQWFLGNSGDTSQPIPDATGTTFTTPTLTVATSYWVRARNVAGDTNSATVTASVITPPEFTTQPISLTINSGQTAILSVIATGTSPAFQWYLGSPGDIGNPILNATDSSFTTPALTADTSYWVRTSNPAGTDDSEGATVTVITPPTITTAPVSTTINQGNTATLAITANGTSPVYQWYQGESGVTTSPVIGASSESFTTPALSTTTSYWVRAENPAGAADSTTAVVTVRIPPTITKQPSPVTIKSGKKATLRVNASGTTPVFQWFKGLAGNTKSPVKGATSPTFTTPVLKVKTTYWVRVSNAAGSVNSKAVIVTVKANKAKKTARAGSVLGSFASWRYSHFQAIANEMISGPAADPDGDGMANSEEYLFGLNPLVSDPSPMPAPAFINGSPLRLTFTARLAAGPGYSGLSRHYALESADMPGFWTAVTGYEDIEGNDGQITYVMPVSGPQKFYRLRAWLAP